MNPERVLRLEQHYFTGNSPPPRGPRISLSYFWQLQWRDAAYGPGLFGVMCFRVARQEEGEVDGKGTWRE